MKDGIEQSGYKNLIVWQRSLTLADHIIGLIDRIDSSRKHYRLYEQLESAVTSIPMNIAEGKGRNTKKEFMRYLYISRGSLYETLTLLEIFKLRGWITTDEFVTIEKQSIEIAKMINGLIKTIAQGS